MNGHLARLAARAAQPLAGLRPRTPALFEQHPILEQETQVWPLETEVLLPETAPRDAQQHGVQPDRQLASRPPTLGPARESAAPARDLGSESPSEGVWGPANSPSARPSSAVGPEMAIVGQAPPRIGAQVGPTDPVEQVVRHPPAEGPVNQPRQRPGDTPDSSKNNADGSLVQTDSTPQLATRGSSTPDLSADRDPARTLPDRAGLAGNVASADAQSRGTQARQTGPTQGAEGSLPRSASTAADKPSSPAPLPRLQPQADRKPNSTPEVTVTIGRIEVLPAPRMVAAPQPVRKPARRTSNAPELGTYLRDRRAQ